MDGIYITGLWALLALAVVVTAYFIYREETRPRNGVSYAQYRLCKLRRNAKLARQQAAIKREILRERAYDRAVNQAYGRSFK